MTRHLQILRVIITSLCVFLLSGCTAVSSLYHKQHFIQNRDNAYQQSRTAPALQTPADVNEVQLGDDYPIAEGNFPMDNQPSSLIPPVIPPGSSAAWRK